MVHVTRSGVLVCGQCLKTIGNALVFVIVYMFEIWCQTILRQKRVAFQIENTRFSKSCFTSQTKSWTTGQSLVLKTPHWWTPNWAFSMPVCVLSLSMVPGPEVVYGPRCCGVSVCTNLENNWVSPMFWWLCEFVNWVADHFKTEKGWPSKLKTPGSPNLVSPLKQKVDNRPEFGP